MKFLFIHQNFPAQFVHLAPALAKEGHDVSALTLSGTTTRNWRGVKIFKYNVSQGSSDKIHPWVADFETKVIRGQACLNAALALKQRGYNPCVIIAHPGWGESLFIKQVWPSAVLKLYCEWYYHANDFDVGFDPEFDNKSLLNSAKVELKNANFLLHADQMDFGISPTHWQINTFPKKARNITSVIHDGIDTATLKPAPQAKLTLYNGDVLTSEHEIITFVSRALEPYRGFHIFMRTLPLILREKPNAIVLIVGKEGIAYGAHSDTGKSWKQIFCDDILPQLSSSEKNRVHFLGFLPRAEFTSLLQITRAHVYLTYPFVLSWSLLEAMSVGCPIVASDTSPVREFIEHNENGVLTDFFDIEELADRIVGLLDDESFRLRLGANARKSIVDDYDLESICLPKQLKWATVLI